MENEYRRIRSINELRVLFTDLDIEGDIKRRRLQWPGQMIRMIDGRLLIGVVDRKSGNRRRAGRPRLGWLEDVERERYSELRLNTYITIKYTCYY